MKKFNLSNTVCVVASLFLLLSLLISQEGLVLAQYSCSCTCCLGNSCTPSNQGSYSVSDCSTCSNSGCASNFANCPNSQQSGSSSASCSQTPAPAPPSGSGTANSWTGTYQVANGQCSTSSCCCFAGSIVVQATSSNSVNMIGGVAGQCFGMTSASANVNNIPPGNDLYGVVFEGNSYNIFRNGRSITVQDTSASQCSGSATCVSGQCLSNTGGTVHGFHWQTTMLLLFTIALLSFVIVA